MTLLPWPEVWILTHFSHFSGFWGPPRPLPIIFFKILRVLYKTNFSSTLRSYEKYFLKISFWGLNKQFYCSWFFLCIFEKFQYLQNTKEKSIKLASLISPQKWTFQEILIMWPECTRKVCFIKVLSEFWKKLWGGV